MVWVEKMNKSYTFKYFVILKYHLLFLEEECSNGKEYVDCANQCDLTCRHISDVEECVSEGCEPGCRCPAGMFLNDDDNCVKQCPCYEDETSYEVDEEMPSDAECEIWLV